MRLVQFYRSARRLGVFGSTLWAGVRGGTRWGNAILVSPVIAVALAALALAACTTRPGPQAATPAPPQPELPAKVRASEIVGRWGYAAYHKPEDRTRTEANARGAMQATVRDRPGHQPAG